MEAFFDSFFEKMDKDLPATPILTEATGQRLSRNLPSPPSLTTSVEEKDIKNRDFPNLPNLSVGTDPITNASSHSLPSVESPDNVAASVSDSKRPLRQLKTVLNERQNNNHQEQASMLSSSNISMSLGKTLSQDVSILNIGSSKSLKIPEPNTVDAVGSGKGVVDQEAPASEKHQAALQEKYAKVEPKDSVVALKEGFPNKQETNQDSDDEEAPAAKEGWVTRQGKSENAELSDLSSVASMKGDIANVKTANQNAGDQEVPFTEENQVTLQEMRSRTEPPDSIIITNLKEDSTDGKAAYQNADNSPEKYVELQSPKGKEGRQSVEINSAMYKPSAEGIHIIDPLPCMEKFGLHETESPSLARPLRRASTFEGRRLSFGTPSRRKFNSIIITPQPCELSAGYASSKTEGFDQFGKSFATLASGTTITPIAEDQEENLSVSGHALSATYPEKKTSGEGNDALTCFKKCEYVAKDLEKLKQLGRSASELVEKLKMVISDIEQELREK
jgi:hypothetical protein